MNQAEVETNGHSAADVIEEVQNAPKFCTLRVWRDVLSNIEAAMDERVPMNVAAKIVAAWPQIVFQETPKYHQRYHELLLEARMLLQGVIDDNPGCLDHVGDDDVVENYQLYKTLVINWNIRLDELEQQWDASAMNSHIEFAAIVDVRGFLFARTGLAGHLEAIGFTLDSDEIIDAIQTARGEK